MKIAVLGASGKTGRHLVRESLARGHEVAAVCRSESGAKLDEFSRHAGFTLFMAPVISDEAMLAKALAGCDAVLAILISVRRLKTTDLVRSLARAAEASGVKRMVFSAGEVTVVPDAGEGFTRRQRFMLAVFKPISWLTPYSLGDMIEASAMIRRQADWNWTIVRAPALNENAPGGYRLGELSEVSGKHSLSRADFAACMLDSVSTPEHHGRALTVLPKD